jgi:hypothetical protein
MIGIVRPEIAWLLVIVGFVVGWRSAKPLWADLKTTIGDLRPQNGPLGLRHLLRRRLDCGAAAALAPVTAWDGLAYHLNGPCLS